MFAIMFSHITSHITCVKVRSTISSLEKSNANSSGGGESREMEMGCRVVEYLLLHGGDPYRRGANGQNAFEHLFATTTQLNPVHNLNKYIYIYIYILSFFFCMTVKKYICS
jgi:hypothetical protein